MSRTYRRNVASVTEQSPLLLVAQSDKRSTHNHGVDGLRSDKYSAWELSYRKECPTARRDNNRSERAKARQSVRSFVRFPELADSVVLPAYRKTSGWLTH